MVKRLNLRFILFLYFLGTLFLTSCWGGEKGGVSNLERLNLDTLKYAKGFNIEYFSNYTQINVINPWDTTKLLQKYILVDREDKLPNNLPDDGTIIKIPIKNAIIYSSVHTSILEELGALNLIVGVCESEYINSKNIKKLIQEGKITDCGASNAPNIEKIIEKNGEIIIASPFENSNYGQAEKLGIPIFEASDYMENTPLGRAEWIKVYGLLSGQKKLADSIFNITEKNYNTLKDLANSVNKKPKLLAERKYGSTWFVPGGYSYMGEMYANAGADYIYRYITKTNIEPLPFEQVFKDGKDADIWIFKYAINRDITYNDIKTENPLYTQLNAFKNKTIYTCNTLITSYYSDITIHPDKILKDLVYIFHPYLIEKEYIPKYYFKVKE